MSKRLFSKLKSLDHPKKKIKKQYWNLDKVEQLLKGNEELNLSMYICWRDDNVIRNHSEIIIYYAIFSV